MFPLEPKNLSLRAPSGDMETAQGSCSGRPEETQAESRPRRGLLLLPMQAWGAMGNGVVRVLGRPCTEGSGANPELLLRAGRGWSTPSAVTVLAQLMLGDTSPMGLLLSPLAGAPPRQASPRSL